MSYKQKVWLLIAVSALAIIGVSFLPPIPQDQAYHNFADKRSWFGIPNTCDVLSNLPFLLFGLLGFLLMKFERLRILLTQRNACLFYFLGVTLTSLGSGWYHLNPNNVSLVWDRLPMTIAFMGLFAFVFAEFVDPKAGRIMLWPLLALGLTSVFWWHLTEQAGQGDLRWYGLVQFLPMLLLPMIITHFKSQWTRVSEYWLMFGWYLLAKIFEYFDYGIFELTGFVSGHTLKHLAAAVGAGWLVLILLRRKPRSEATS